MLTAQSETKSSLSVPKLAAFALPAFPLAAIIFPSAAILPSFYARHTEISITTIGIILIVARIFDSVVDPLIGYLSDATHSRWGARKPWVIAGTVILSIAAVHLYAPASTVGAGYYLGWFLAFYLGYSLIEIPQKAWGTDLARGYEQRASIAASLAIAFALGNLAFALAPFIMTGNQQGFDAETLAGVGWMVSILLPITVITALCCVGRGTAKTTPAVSVVDMSKDIIRNGLLLRFLIIFLFTGFGQGIFYGLIYLYVTVVLDLTVEFAWILLADAVIMLLSIPVWRYLIARYQKHRAWAIGLTICALSIFGLWFVPTGQSGLAMLMILICARAFGAGVINVAPNALLGDVVDYELLKRGANRAASFHALVSIVTKLTATVGSGIGLLAIGLAGFDAKGGNDAQAIFAFQTIILALPTVILIAGAYVAIGFPLGRARHDIVRRRLERRSL